MEDHKPEFALTQSERQSALWSRLTEYMTNRLDTLRKQNDGDLTEIQTAKLRGQISTLKALVRLGDDMPPIEED